MRHLRLLSFIPAIDSRLMLLAFIISISCAVDSRAETGVPALTTCRMAATKNVGSCQGATNQYTVSGTVSFSFIPAGTLTITDDGANTNAKTITIPIAANATSTPYSLSGITSGGRFHTLTFTFSTCASPVSLTYLSPTSCTAVACTGTNLLLNPSFEQGFTTPPTGQQTQVPPPNWIGGTADNNPNAFAAPDGYAYAFSGDNGATLCQSVSATAGTTYKMTFYGGVHEVHGQTVTLSFLNGTTLLGNQQSFNQTHILESDNAFGGPYSLSGVAPTGTTQVRVCAVSANNTGYQYWSKIDNLCLTATPPPCGLAMTVTPGICLSAVNNSYVLSGSITATNVPTSGTLTIASGAFPARTLSLSAGNTSGTFSYSGLVSNGQAYTVTATYDNSACAPVSKTYTAPASCSVAPVVSYALSKTVNKNRVAKGGIVTYMISLTNTGNTTATNLVLTDQLSNTAVTFIGSISASSGTFTAGLNNGSWTITSLVAGSVATLAFNVQLNWEGITYNTVTGPDGHTVTVCTSVPYRVCATEDFVFRLSAPASFSAYQWSLNGQPIAGATANTLSATALGEYSVTVNGEDGCGTGSCCPYIIESYGPPPSLTAVAIAASCNGATPLNDAKITLTGSSTGAVSYNLSLGSSFSAATALFAANQPLSALVDGLLLTGQPNPGSAPGQSYTIRVYSAEGCYSDSVVVIPPAQCQCQPASCLPITVRIVR